MLAAVAKGLRGLKEKVVFVGGATIDLYLSDPLAPTGRATDDVDCVVGLARRMQYYNLEEELRKLGFKHPMGRKGPICRWEFRGIQVDVMPTEGAVLGFKNRWYADGLANAEPALLHDGQEVLIFAPPYLLASKMEAFIDRGKEDFLASPDMEDILAIIGGCLEIKEKILKSAPEVRSYLTAQFREFLADHRFVEAVQGNILVSEKGINRAGRALTILREIAAPAP